MSIFSVTPVTSRGQARRSVSQRLGTSGAPLQDTFRIDCPNRALTLWKQLLVLSLSRWPTCRSKSRRHWELLALTQVPPALQRRAAVRPRLPGMFPVTRESTI